MQREIIPRLKGLCTLIMLCCQYCICVSQPCNELPIQVDGTQAPLFCDISQLECLEFDQVVTTFTEFPSYQWADGCAGTVENPNWFSFVAWTPLTEITITYENCTNLGSASVEPGIQLFFFDAPFDWDVSATPLAYNCDCAVVYDGSGLNTYELTTEPLLIGQQYWVMIDGCAGNTCEVQIEFTNLPVTDPTTGQVDLPAITTHTIDNSICEDDTRICVETPFEVGFPEHAWVGGVDYTVAIYDAGGSVVTNFSTDTSAFEFVASLPGDYTFDVFYQNICDDDSPPYEGGSFTILEPDTLTYLSDTLCLNDAPNYVGWPSDWAVHGCFPSAMPGENLYECKYIDTCGCARVEQKTILVLPLVETPAVDTVVCPGEFPFIFGGLLVNGEMPSGMLNQVPGGTQDLGCDSFLFVQVYAPMAEATMQIIGCTGLEVTYEVTLGDYSDYLDPNQIDILWYENGNNVNTGTTYTTSIDSTVSIDLSWTYGTTTNIVNCVEPIAIDTTYVGASESDYTYPDVSCRFSNDTVFYDFSFLPVPPSLVEINQLTSFPFEVIGNTWVFPNINSMDAVSIEMTAMDGDCGVPPVGPITCSTECTNYSIELPQDNSVPDCVDFSFLPIFLAANVSPSPSTTSTTLWIDENGQEVTQPFIPVDGIDSTYQFTYQIQDPGCTLQSETMELSFAYPREIDILVTDVYICEGMPINTDTIVSAAAGVNWSITNLSEFDIISQDGEHTELTSFTEGVHPLFINGGTADCPSSVFTVFRLHVERQTDFDIRCLDSGYPIQFTWDNFGCMESYDVYVNNEFITNQTNATYTPLGFPPGTDLEVVVVPISNCLCDYDEITITCNTGFCPFRETDLTWRDTTFCVSEIPATLSNRIELVGLGISDNFVVEVDQTIGTTLYEQEIVFNALCSYKDTFFVTIVDIPTVNLEGYGPQCYYDANGGVLVDADLTDFEDGVTVNGASYLLSELMSTPFPPDSYEVTLESIGGCDVNATFEVPPTLEPSASFAGFGSDCFDEADGGVVTDVNPDQFEDEILVNGTPYLLSEMDDTPFPPESYTVDLVSVEGCDVIANFTVPSGPQDFTMSIAGDDSVLENSSGTYVYDSDGQAYESIQWFLDGTLVAEGTELYEVESFGAGPNTVTLTVEITLSTDCAKLETLAVTVIKPDPPAIFISNIFNPNNPDNSHWVIGSDVEIEVPTVQVYDRWGNLVYSRTDLLLDGEMALWDGTLNGNRLETGVYLYTITYQDLSGEIFREVGDITLIR